MNSNTDAEADLFQTKSGITEIKPRRSVSEPLEPEPLVKGPFTLKWAMKFIVSVLLAIVVLCGLHILS
ncbi:MAG: hypothetical protein KBC33_03230 [Candidatus Pacebacteria bacterium]|nr:hypothetical protein [Candidatus Paceibacterota bacterium]